ncbi:MAG TPA: hypothetical protein VFT72_01215 [Opitutaceae bacterium]|nr:hypothetical protein [Opitutaceae bacterium]
MNSESRRTERIKRSLPRGIRIGKFLDGRGKPWFVRYGKDRRCQSFASEGERNDYAEKIGDAVEKEGIHAVHWDPEEWSAYRAFRARVGLSLSQIEEILQMVKQAGSMMKDRHPGMPDLMKSPQSAEETKPVSVVTPPVA